MRQNGVRSNVRFPYAAKKAKGGSVKKQGANDRLDESLGAKHGKKSQSYKARRDESAAMSKKMYGHKYGGDHSMAYESHGEKASVKQHLSGLIKK